jgi:hypothetical protein
MRGQGVVVGDPIAHHRSHADWRAAYGRLGKYRFVGASAIGKWHRHEGRPRDDAFAVRAAGVWLAVAVSDGVGSCPSSRYGSSFAVQTLSEHLLQETLRISSQELPQTDVSSRPEEACAQEESPPPEAVSTMELPSTKSSREPFPSLSCVVTPPTDEQANAWVTWDLSLVRNESEGVATDALQLVSEEAVRRASQHTRLDLEEFAEKQEFSLQDLRVTWSVYDLSLGRNESEGVATDALQLSSVSEEAVRRAFRHTRHDLEKFAKEQGFSLQDLHCTLLGLVLNTETGAFAVGQIGDGVIAAWHPDHKARFLVEAPTPGEAGQTYVLTQSGWGEYLAVKAYPSEEAEGWTTFYLMTDGVADDCIYPPPEGIFERWAQDMDREVRKEDLPQTASRLLYWLATYKRRGSWDDRTLVVVFRE